MAKPANIVTGYDADRGLWVAYYMHLDGVEGVGRTRDEAMACLSVFGEGLGVITH